MTQYTSSIDFIGLVVFNESCLGVFAILSKDQMLELAFAYLITAALIVGLFFLALRNQKQGWRKNRGAWWELQTAGTGTEFEATPDLSLQQLGNHLRTEHVLAGQHQPEMEPALSR